MEPPPNPTSVDAPPSEGEHAPAAHAEPTPESPAPSSQTAPSGIGAAAFLGLLNSLTSITFSVLRSKVTAVVLGPVGLGRASEITQIVTLANVPSGIFTGPALLAHIARAHEDGDEARVERAAATAMVGGALSATLAGLIAVIVGFFALPAPWGRSAWPLMLMAAVAPIIGAFAGVPSQMLMAYRQLTRMLVLGLITSALSVALTVGGTVAFGLAGQFAGALIATAVAVPITFAIAAPGLRGVSLRPRFVLERGFVVEAARVGVASLIAGFALQGALTAMRWALDHHGGAALSGQFQAAWVIGAMYFNIVASSLGVHVFPRYAAARTAQDLARETDEAMRFVLRVVPPLVLAAIAMRRVVITVFYSHRFDPAIELLGYMMAADIVRAASWVQGGPLLYRGEARGYLVTEALGAGMLGAGAVLLVPHLGLIGIGVTYFGTYVLYLVIVSLMLSRTCGVRVPWGDLLTAIALGGGALAAMMASNYWAPARWLLLLGAFAWSWRAGLVTAGLRVTTTRYRKVRTRLGQLLRSRRHAG